MQFDNIKKSFDAMWFVTLICLMASFSLIARSDGSQLNSELQDLKEELLNINRDLFILEEDLLFPASTQINIFVSQDGGNLFQLDSVQVKIGGKIISSYLYTEREIKALLRGGIQRLYVGNLGTGKHELVAVFTGLGPDKRTYKRATSVVFEKTSETKMIELKITDDNKKRQPQFTAKIWQ